MDTNDGQMSPAEAEKSKGKSQKAKRKTGVGHYDF
jgi:hypothetical protein